MRVVKCPHCGRDLGAKPERARVITLADIRAAVCAEFQISEALFMSLDKHKSLSWPRYVFVCLARELTQSSYPEIGRFLGRHHTGSLLAFRRGQHELMASPRFAKHLNSAASRAKELSEKGAAA